MSEQKGPYGPAVDDAIMAEFFPTGEPSSGFGSGQQQQDPMRSTVAALGVIERHLEPITSANLAALTLLRMEGGDLAEIADFWMEKHHLRGHASALTEALTAASFMRSFKGMSGSVVKTPPPVPGGFRR